MDKKIILLAAIFGLAIAFSGCIDFAPTPPAEDIGEEAPAVEMLDYPTTVQAGQVFAVKWRVNLEGMTTHTSVHWANVSYAGEFGTNVTPASSGYTDLVTDFASGNFTIPAEFEGNATASSSAGTMYMRGHVIFEGAQYWTDEFTVTVTGTATGGAPNNSNNGSGYFGY